MRAGSAGGLRRIGGLRRGGAAVLLLSVLTGCAGSGEAPATSAVGQFFRGTTEEPTAIDPELLRSTLPCPAVTIQPGTESLRREDDGGGAEALRWQASITRTARECTLQGEGESAALAVRVGVSGRVVEGSRGAPETIELPLRVAVREGGEVTYSKLHTVRVTLEEVSQTWAFVDEDVRVTTEDARILIGFDG
jgi:hypothetical protein